MSIVSQITALNADKTAIAAAITAKGGTVGQNAGFDTFAQDIGNIPFASGTVTFPDFTDTLSVTNLAFAPTKITIIGIDARLHLSTNGPVYGFIGYDANPDNTYKFIAQLRTADNQQQGIWTSNFSNFITVTSNGFTIFRSGYYFAKEIPYFWVAYGDN